MGTPDYADLRRRVEAGAAVVDVADLVAADLDTIAWSGGRAHLENVASQLSRVESGEVEYVVVRADGLAVSKGGIDFAKEPGAGTVWQVASHPEMEGLGLATRLFNELEGRARRRGVGRLRLGVEPDNGRALRLYEHLGYRAFGQSATSWETEAEDGSRFVYRTTLIEMIKVHEMHFEDLVRALHEVDELRDTGKRHPHFQFRSRPFLHFHGDGAYADVRFGDDFERIPLANPSDRAALLERVKAHVAAPRAARRTSRR